MITAIEIENFKAVIEAMGKVGITRLSYNFLAGFGMFPVDRDAEGGLEWGNLLFRKTPL